MLIMLLPAVVDSRKASQYGNCTVSLPGIEESGAEQWLVSLCRHIIFYSELINSSVLAAFQPRDAMSAKLQGDYQRTATEVLRSAQLQR